MNNLERLHISSNWKSKFNMNVTMRDIDKTAVTPHWHDFYELEVILSGEGTAMVNGSIYPVFKGSLFFITPSDFHSFSLSSPLRLINLTFAPSCIEAFNFAEQLSCSGYIACSLDDKLTEYFCHIITLIKDEIENKRYLSTQYVSNLLSCILITLFRISKNNNPARELDSAAQKLLYYVHTHFKEPISLDDIVSFTGYSKVHICRIFKNSLNCTFKEYLTMLRITHAEQLLINSDESISDIAYFCGFSSLSRFINVFKSKHMLSPRAFRRQFRDGKQQEMHDNTIKR